MFEHRREPLLPRGAFLRRLAGALAISLALIVASLFMGMAGYHYYEGMPWVDAFANAAMILSGMGPLAPLQTTAGKLFAGFYALYSGLAIITVASVTLAPIVHRLLHKLHVDVEDQDEDHANSRGRSGAML